MSLAPRDLARRFDEMWGPGPVHIARAPYRVAPLGAHTDHQNGLVLGFALDVALLVAFRPRGDGGVRARSVDFPGEIAFAVDDVPPPDGGFGDYLRGVTLALAGMGGIARGVDALISGGLPPGGVSSSAALQIAFATVLAAANDKALDRRALFDLTLAAERAYAGVPVGMLDPAVILWGEPGHSVTLDCAEGVPRAQRLPQKMPPFEFVLVDSGVPRDLRDGRYAQRVAECSAAALALGATGQPPLLCEITPEALRRRRSEIDPLLARRAEHVLSENKRVRHGITALQQGDLAAFGRHVSASGNSMATFFDAGTPETLWLLTRLQRAPGVFGAAFSGAGFGGSLLAITRSGAAADVAAALGPAYAGVFPSRAAGFGVRAVGVGGGVGVDAVTR